MQPQNKLINPEIQRLADEYFLLIHKIQEQSNESK